MDGMGDGIFWFVTATSDDPPEFLNGQQLNKNHQTPIKKYKSTFLKESFCRDLVYKAKRLSQTNKTHNSSLILISINLFFLFPLP